MAAAIEQVADLFREHRRRAFLRGFIAEAIVRFATDTEWVDYLPVEERFPE